MISFLPTPQELHYRGGKLRLSGAVSVTNSPGEREDALLEVLSGDLKSIGVTADVSNGDEKILLITTHSDATAELAELARTGLTEKVRTPTVYREGPYMPNEASMARRMTRDGHLPKSGKGSGGRSGRRLWFDQAKEMFWLRSGKERMRFPVAAK